MKRTVLFSLILIIFCKPIYSQVTFNQLDGPYGGCNEIVIDGEDNLYASTSDGLYISTNNGERWQNIAPDILDAKITVNKKGVLLVVSGSKLYLIKDKGKTRTEKERSLPPINCLAMDSKNNIFIGTEEGLYVSRDEGSSFVKNKQISDRVNSIIVDSKNTIIMGTNTGLYTSNNGGISFVKSKQINDEIHAISIDNKDNIYFLNMRMIYKSTDGGNTFYSLELPIGYSSGYFAVNPKGDIFAGVENNYSLWYSTTDNGKTWNTFNAFESYIVFNSKGCGFSWGGSGASTDYACIFKLSQEGNGPEISNTGINTLEIWDIKINSNGDLLVNSHNGLYKSTDKGNNWIDLPNGYSECSMPFPFFHLNTYGHIYVFDYFLGSEEKYSSYTIFSSMDNGKTWKTHEWGDKNDFVSMGIDHKDNIYLLSERENKIYRLGNNGKKTTFFCNLPTALKECQAEILFNKKNEIYLVTNDALYFSSDQGKKWNKLNLIPTIRDVEITQTGEIFALITNSERKSSLYLSKDNGKNWEKFLELPENMGSINCFAFDDEGCLLCGTSGRGLWKSEKPVIK